MNVPHPAPVSAISSTGVAVAWGVTDGVPGPGVVVGTNVMVGGGVLVAGPGTGVFVRVGLGGLVADGGLLVGGMGEMVTIGVTGRSVGDGISRRRLGRRERRLRCEGCCRRSSRRHRVGGRRRVGGYHPGSIQKKPQPVSAPVLRTPCARPHSHMVGPSVC